LRSNIYYLDVIVKPWYIAYSRSILDTPVSGSMLEFSGWMLDLTGSILQFSGSMLDAGWLATLQQGECSIRQELDDGKICK